MTGALLLDTHVLLWWIQQSPRLSATAISAIERTPSVFFSSLNVFEIELKRERLGELPDSYLQDIRATGFTELAFSADAAASLPPRSTDFSDPFDRALIAQATVIGATLLTADWKILTAAPHLTMAV